MLKAAVGGIDIGERPFLEPTNLGDDYKVDGLSVAATVAELKHAISTCMIGKMVSVLSIEKR